MTNLAERLEALLHQVNSGDAATAMPELDALLVQHPGHLGALALRAEALRLTGRPTEAIATFRAVGESGGGARNWLAAGVLLAAERSTEEALHCLQNALAEMPDNDEVLDALITTLFNANRQHEGIEYARRQLAVSGNPRFLSHAALLLQSNDLYEESSNAFKKIVELAPNDPAVAGAALVPARFTCEWEWIEALQKRIGVLYDAGDFDAAHEYPLTHLTWCADEQRNLGVTQAYLRRMVPTGEPVSRKPPAGQTGRRLRVGYLSCDFRNHATMHLMAGLFEAHDRERFEIFAYDYSNTDVSDYRQRFLSAIEHHVSVHALGDRQAAARIVDDELDILFDLKLYTGGGRPGILALRPAALQVAYLGFPGSAASADIDYIVSDRFVTPDSSTRWYTEKFCRLPHTYQCNDRKRHFAARPGARAAYGLPDDKVVFGAFNQSYKIDPTSFSVWLRVLAAVPDSVLWLLGQSEAAIANLTRHAQLAGIEPERLVFAPFAAPHDHLARLQLADAVLDTLVCNGHTTTSDALWAGVPVITARGVHFPSRVSESLLNAIDLPELVGADHDDMVRIAQRIATDAQWRMELREKIAAGRLSAPLFDTLRFTRNFERGIELMVERRRNGLPDAHIDVADCGPVQEPDHSAPAGTAAGPKALRARYEGCPLCGGGGASVTLGFANSTRHGLFSEPEASTIAWMRCPSCGHVHNQHYPTEAGLAEAAQPLEYATDADAHRAAWAPVVEKSVALLGGYRALARRDGKALWVDVGCGDGGLVMTAADCGFAAVGLDLREQAVSRIQALGYDAMQHDFTKLKFEVVVDVLSLMNVLEYIPRAREALERAAQILPQGGVLVIATADLLCSAWKAMDAARTNPYWMERERCHHFTRARLLALLDECGFEMADFALSARRKANMEVYAVRR
ncbi:methyltransferase domain-containing protein [Paraburkholderia panacisoli]|nr:methyltransferase domain-containing protein [Paraburkholderia panacisoli]